MFMSVCSGRAVHGPQQAETRYGLALTFRPGAKKVPRA